MKYHRDVVKLNTSGCRLNSFYRASWCAWVEELVRGRVSGCLLAETWHLFFSVPSFPAPGAGFSHSIDRKKKCLSVSRLFYFRLFPICVRERIVVGSLQSCLWKQVLPLGKTSLFSKIHATHSSTWEFGVQGLQDTVFFCWLRFLAKLFIL